MNRKQKLLRYLPVVIAIVLILIVAGVIYVFRDLFAKPVQTKKQIQQVTILQPPPPPPPPPEQPPPPPEVKEEKIEEPEPPPEPEEQAEEPAPGDELGVDAEGGAGSDSFGLVGKKGGQGLLAGGGGSAIIWYGQQIGRALQDQLQDLLAGSAARKTSYAVTVNVWIGPDGRLSRAELATGSGKSEVDEALRQAMPRLRLTLQKSPPENMPQPVKVRVASKI